MAQVDSWEKAAECGRVIEAVKDPHQRAVLRNLRNLWVALGNKERLLRDPQVLKEIQDLDRLHVQFLNGTQIIKR